MYINSFGGLEQFLCDILGNKSLWTKTSFVLDHKYYFYIYFIIN